MADKFNPVISILTPASDPITAGGDNSEVIFARAGNDTIYSYDVGKDNNENENIDFLFGDLFDNNLEEYLTFVAIQDGSNPLRVLQTGPPAVGADKFALGDAQQPYYLNIGSQNDLKITGNNFLGLNEYAVIYDFNPAQDTIQLNGKPQDYLLVDINGVKVEGVDQLFYGKGIFSLQEGGPDLIGYIIAAPGVQLDLNDSCFEYVGSKPQKVTSPRKITQLGTTGIDRGLDTAVDPAGNVYVTGSTSGPLNGTARGSSDVWVNKYDSNGNLLWGKQFGSTGSESAYSVVTDKDGNFYLSGDTGGNLFSSKQTNIDIWVAKYDSNGQQLWAKQFAPNVANAYASASFGLDVDQGGNVYLSGLSIQNNTRPDIYPFLSAVDDSWVTKFDSNGNQQWLTTIQDATAPYPLNLSPFFDENYSMAVDNSGNSYLAGWTQGLVREANPSSPFLKYDAWVSKVDSTGKVQWVQQFGSINEGVEVAWAVDTDSKGNVYTTGYTTGDIGTKTKPARKSGPYDMFLTKFSPDGTQLWARQFGSKGDDGTYLSDMQIDSQDNIYLTGYTNDKIGKGQKDAAYNAFVAKFDSNGTNKWIQEFGSKGKRDTLTGISVDNTGHVFVTGYTDGSLGTANNGGVDAFVAQLDANNGKLKKFLGNSTNLVSVADPGPISTVDVSSYLVTDDKLPKGDNRIDPLEGTGKSGTVLNYGQINSKLVDIFSPDSQSSFSTVLSDGVASGNAPFLSDTDLKLLQP